MGYLSFLEAKFGAKPPPPPPRPPDMEVPPGDAKAYVRRHLYVFLQVIVQSMFKHVASENCLLVLILQSYSQVSIVLKYID